MLLKLLKTQHPLCFNIALKIMKMLQQELGIKIYDAEVIYLTLHVYHFMVDADHTNTPNARFGIVYIPKYKIAKIICKT